MKEDMLSLFFAGHDTTASSIAYCLYFLAKHPKYQDDARTEAFAFLQTFDSSKNTSTKEILLSLPRIRLIILESWRLLPPAAATLARRVATDGAILGGCKLTRGSFIFGTFVTAHRSEKVWGKNAAEFVPERFCLDPTISLDIDPQIEKQLLTFSVGSRACLGNNFATIQVHLALVKLLSEFKFSIPEGSPHADRCQVKPKNALMTPQDLKLQVRKL